MTERGLPTSDGAPACPFVAFDDDRDERATSPDHRHRCYAEPNPAPRALAHQEAYCLSSAFPVCPTFQDWARREAARSRGESGAAADSSAASIAAQQAQRNPPRSWQAPPPWMAGDPRPEEPDEIDDRWERDEDVVPPALVHGPDPGDDEDVVEEVPASGRGLSGSYADRVAAGGAAAAAGGAAGAFSGEPPDMAARPRVTGIPDASPDWRESPAPSAEATVRPRRERDPDRMAGFTESHASGPPHPQPTGRGERRRDPRAPEWEPGRPLEAFPTLRARRLPELSVPPILVSVIALALAAAVLFALPGLLGFGSPGGAVATPTQAGSSQQPEVSLAPTPVPDPTQQIYIVRANDTMSRIANRFDVPLDELIAANAENIPNPDSLQIGDQVIIPVPESNEIQNET